MTWKQILASEQNKRYYQALESSLEIEEKKYTIYPEKKDRFSFMDDLAFDDIKVVILGQDPYHNPNQAHGLAFSVKCDKLPPSLKNIYKEIESDLEIKMSHLGNLESWKKQGVLLLNTVLTVRKNEPNSHKGLGWENFTEAIIKALAEENRPIVFILWGNHARGYKRYIKNALHLVIEANHPSPFSAYKGFFGSKPFSQANNYLMNHHLKPINFKI